MKQKLKWILKFLQKDVWRIRASSLSKQKSFLIKSIRILIVSFREFGTDNCYLRASALTFFSLLSIVPVFAMGFGVAKGFGFEKALEKMVLENLKGQEEIAKQIMDFANKLLENTQGGLIAGVGLVVLFWSVIKVLGNIEKSFNHIWGVKKERPMLRKFSDYLSLMLICPLVLILSGSITVFLASQIEFILQKLSLYGFFRPLLIGGLKLTPLILICSVLSFIYAYMPNTKVKLPSAVLGGLVSGILYQLVQWIYIKFQIGAANFGAVYGSFAVLPLFLVWLQLSWLVILYGAEVAFAHQNEETFEFEPDCLSVSKAGKRLVALRICQLVIQSFCLDKPASTGEMLSKSLGLPIRLTLDVLHDLVQSGVLIEVQNNGGDPAYHPAHAVDKMSVKSVIDRLELYGSNDFPIIESKELKDLRKRLNDFSKLVEKSQANILIRDI
jgi:membrane protein